MGRLLLDSSGGRGLPEGAVIGIIVGVCFAPFVIVVLCLICGCLCSGCRGCVCTCSRQASKLPLISCNSATFIASPRSLTD